MNRRGFTFLEILVALAILTVLSVSLIPLMTRLTEADQRSRSRAAAWRAAQSGLTALHLNDVRSWQEAHPAYELKWEQTAQTGTVFWSRLSVIPAPGDQPEAVVYVEAGMNPPGINP